LASFWFVVWYPRPVCQRCPFFATFPVHFLKVYSNTSTPGRYFGYFENEHKEQFIFEYDHQSKTATLWVGDYSWEKPVKVVNGDAPELILSDIERLWLRACWKAATTFEKP
jgi:hypothetical protein